MAGDLRDLSGRLPGAPAADRPAIGTQLQSAQIHLNRAVGLLQAGDTSQTPIEIGNAGRALVAARQQLERGLALQAQATQQVLAAIGAERTRWRSLAEKARRAPGGGQAMVHLDAAGRDLDDAENSARRGDGAGAENGLARARLKMKMVAEWLEQLDQKASGEGQRLLAEVGRMRAELGELSGRLAGAPAATRQAIEQQLASVRTNLNIAEGVARAGGPQVVQARIPLGNARQALDAARRQLK
jgi:hypothetical protein